MSGIARFGDRAYRFSIREGQSRRALFGALSAIPEVDDVVLTEEVGAVVHRGALTVDALERVLAESWTDAGAEPSHAHVIEVAYDGPDLETIAERLSLSREALIAAHADREYVVAMLGFLPGFAYLRGLDPRLVLERRAEPRPRVPANSVAIAAEYTGIYPFASPGGWHLLGRALDFLPFTENAALLKAGDRVRFLPARGSLDVAKDGSEPAPAPRGPYLEVTKLAGVGLLVDGGRLHHMHEGVPRGGPLIASALAAANEAAGNANGACAIELLGSLRVTARNGAVRVADDQGQAIELVDGAEHTIATAHGERVRYLAVAGGFDVPRVLGGRGTLLVARLGGLEGRPLRRGDQLPIGDDGEGAVLDDERVRASLASDDRIPVVVGPDLDGAALRATLADASFKIAASSDRTGTRLEGPNLAVEVRDASRASRPMVLGAIELTPSGLIVLGPDHPTTGGYPVAGVLATRGLDAFFRKAVGARVSFVVE